MADVTKRDLVKQCIDKGNMTKAEIVEELGMSAGSVSTQMTYLRWMDNYIMTDPETKVLSFTDQETFEAFEAEKKTKKKSGSTSTRTPEERAVATAKTIANQEKALVKWEAKAEAAAEVLADMPDDADAILNDKEAKAMVAVTEVKLARNQALAADLPDLPEPVEAEEATDEVEAEDTEDLL